MIPTTDLAKLVDYLEAGNKGDWNPGWRDATIMHAKKCEGPLRSLLESHARMEEALRGCLREMSWALDAKVGGPVQPGGLFEKARDNARSALEAPHDE